MTNGARFREWPELILEQLEDAGVARVVLNRPDKRNCLNEALVAAWFEALDIVRADRDLKVGDHQRRGDLFFLRPRSALSAQGERRAARLGSPNADRADGRNVARLPAHRHCAGARLLPGWRARHHELPRSRVRGRRRAVRHAGNSARQFRSACHLNAGARRHPDQEGGADAARRPQHFRRRGRPLGHHLAGAARRRSWKRR